MKPDRDPLLNGVEPEPQVGTGELPIIFFGILAGLLFVGLLYLDKYAGGFDNMVYRPYESFNQVSGLQPQDPTAKKKAQGKRIYEAGCMLCHQATGLGTPGTFPPLDGSEWVNGPVGRLARIPLHGIQGPITVKGEAYAGSMPAVGGSFNDEEIAALLTYIRSAWSNRSGEVMTEQIKKVRDAEAARAQQWTGPELLKINE